MASKTGVVRISGRGSNVDFAIDDEAPFHQITEELREYLSANRGLWSSGTITVDAGRFIRSRDHLGRIKEIIESGSGLTVGRFWCSSDKLDDPEWSPPDGSLSDAGWPSPLKAAGAAEPAAVLPASPKPARTAKSSASNSRKGLPSEALFIKATFRSGESIRHAGDVVVLADVNPGAEITAEGDIVVFGSLRGFAHAGAAGNTKAAIIALELDAPRIQIGPYIGLAPDVSPPSNPMRTGPTIAYVRRRAVYTSPYAGRFARYSRGTLYDG